MACSWAASILVEHLTPFEISVRHGGTKEKALQQLKAQLEMVGAKCLKKPQLLVLWKHIPQMEPLDKNAKRKQLVDRIDRCLANWNKEARIKAIATPQQVFNSVKPSQQVSFDSSKPSQATSGAWEEIVSKDANRHCLVSRKYSQVKSGGLAGILALFHVACESSEFIEKCNKLGLREGSFHTNPFLQPGHSSYDKFLNALKKLDDDAILGVAFHGTGSENIDTISCNGLDPKKRSGQAHGPGEYFAKNPQISVAYCKQGTEMFVFLVVIPKAQAAIEMMGGASILKRDLEEYCKADMGVYRDHIPHNFIVVENNCHQLPIGTMMFESVDSNVILKAQELKARLFALAEKAEAQQVRVEETSIKSAIMQNLMNSHVEAASKQYIENCSILTEVSRREIAWYVHSLLKDDPKLEAVLFPDLPPPIKASEMALANIQSLEMAVKLESKARKDLLRTQNLLTKKEKEEERQGKKDEGVAETTAYNPRHKGAQQPKPAEEPMSVLSAVLHNITCNRLDVAAELYGDKVSVLDEFSKRQIAIAINRNVSDEEKDLIACLFPDLPGSEEVPVCPQKRKHG